MEKGRQQRKRHILGGPLSEVEVETLQEMASHHRHANFRRRALGVLALNDGRSGPAISGVLRVSVPQLYNWALAWRERGLMGMLSGHVGGAPRKLTASLLQTAVQIACDDSLTLAKIAQRVKEQHPDAPSFSLSRLSVGLRSQGLSYKRNRLSLKKRDQQRFEAMQKSLNQLREAAKKENEKMELLYFDEAGVCNMPNVQRGWSPLSKPHRADASMGRKRVNVLGALNYAAGTLAFEVHEHSVCRQDVLNFLDKQARNSARDKLTVVVLDNASIHHHIDPNTLEEWMVRDRFILLFLPPYSPELNLIEILWKQAKYHWRSFATWAKQDLLQEVQALFGGFGTKFKLSYA